MALPFIDQLPAGERAGFTAAVIAMAKRLGIKAEWAMVVMQRESELKPTARNGSSGATGLIQFMPQTALWLGTSVNALRTMSATQQLVWVEKYWRLTAERIGRKPQNVYDLYLMTLHPASVGKATSATVFAAGTAAYRQNRGLDKAAKGYVTVADVRAFVDRSTLGRATSGRAGYVASEANGAATPGLKIGALLFAGTLSYLAYKFVLPLKPTK